MVPFQNLSWTVGLYLTKADCKVLLALCSVMDFDRYTIINQTELAQEIPISRSRVSASIKKLLSLNIILEGPKAGMNKTYMINPEMVIKDKPNGQNFNGIETTVPI